MSNALTISVFKAPPYARLLGTPQRYLERTLPGSKRKTFQQDAEINTVPSGEEG